MAEDGRLMPGDQILEVILPSYLVKPSHVLQYYCAVYICWGRWYRDWFLTVQYKSWKLRYCRKLRGMCTSFIRVFLCRLMVRIYFRPLILLVDSFLAYLATLYYFCTGERWGSDPSFSLQSPAGTGPLFPCVSPYHLQRKGRGKSTNRKRG